MRPTSGTEPGPQETDEWGTTAYVTWQTSRREFAESATAAVLITFFGDRAVSDTLVLAQAGDLASPGGTATVALELSRELGQLLKVRLETNSTDGWLCNHFEVQVGTESFFFEPPLRFLDEPDAALATTEPGGLLNELYEPQAPTRAALDEPQGGSPSARGLQGMESVELTPVRTVPAFRDPLDFTRSVTWR